MKTNSCIKNLLKLICVLQDNSENIHLSNASCTRPFLGPDINALCYNTRVITLYNKQGNLFTTTYNDSGDIKISSTFRIINVDEDYCTLLILDNTNNEYISTNQTIVVNLNCICAVKCNGDVVVNNL